LDDFKNEHWEEASKRQCDRERFGVPNMKCYIYRIYLFPVKVEVRSEDPPLIVLKHLIPKNYIKEFLKEINQRHLEQQIVIDAKTGQRVPSPGRNANGTRLQHHETPTSSKIFNLIMQRVAAVDFRSAETFSVLSYNAGGHYAPHHDFLPEQFAPSEMTKRLGNRFATFLFILKTATKGGGTVFPLIHTTVQPEEGDALLWLNMNTGYTVENKSLHAACPILEGTKIAVTLWVRRLGHEMLVPCHKSGTYDLE
ncbi:hypothetical protein PFISCL1PPCAC_8935, partial [Pristionchus fissidentatus]